MIFLLLLMAGAPQSNGDACLGTPNALDCRSVDGSTYIERRLGDQVVRRGIDKNGASWTEYTKPVFDGTRTEGSDSRGRTWASQCSPRFGTTGTDRNGRRIFIAPRPRRTPTPGDTTATTEANPCG